MGNYLFEPGLLAPVLEQAARRGGTDFGRHVMPDLPGRRAVYAYDLAENVVPGVQAYEESAYWRDVGTLPALRAARRDIPGERPRFRLHNPRWPIRGLHFDHRSAA